MVSEEIDALDQFWMQRALELAQLAQEQGEIPIGAVVVKDDEIIGEGYNRSIALNDPTAHAEIQALRQAAQRLSNYRLVDTSLYVTIEPCVMCAGALIHARVKEVIYGATEPKTGAAGSQFNLLQDPAHNHQLVVRGGVLAEQCGELLSSFFQVRRQQSKKTPSA